MSDADQPERKWRHYVQDMIEFSNKVTSYTSGMSKDQFVSDSLVYDGTLRNLELIGEAAIHVPRKIRAAYPKIPWRSIIGTRNRVAHAYLGIDDDVIWDIILTDVPSLLDELQALLRDTEEESG